MRFKCFGSGSPPTHLYKYVEAATAKLILDRGSLRFTPYLELNDPFEFLTKYSEPRQSTPEEGARADMIALREGGVDGREMASWRQERRNQIERVRTLRRSLRSIGVLCLTENPGNLLMWAHYAKGHSGVLFRFRVDRLRTLASEEPWLAPFPSLQRVRYSRSPPRVTPSKENMVLTATLLSKSEDWRYEREWRICRDISKIEYVPLLPDTLDAIYFGARISEAMCEALKKSASESVYFAGVSMFNATLSSDRYAIQFAPIGF